MQDDTSHPASTRTTARARLRHLGLAGSPQSGRLARATVPLADAPGSPDWPPAPTILEVLRYDGPTDSAIVCSASGTRTNWFQNIDRNPEVIITVVRRERPARAERLAVPNAAQELLDHAQRHPTMFRLLTRWLVGRGVEGTPVACSELARSCPVVAFRPGDASGRHEPSPSDRSRRSTRRSPRSGGS